MLTPTSSPTDPQSSERTAPLAATHPSFAEAFRFWVKLGLISFGGPTGQIAIMQTELVERKRWISHERFLHALNFCMLLPGPEAQQLAIYIGWLLHRTWGGIVAGAFFVLPSVFILLGLSYIYAAYGNIAWIAAVFYGLKPVVMAIVASAVIRIGRKALKNSLLWCIAAAAFLAIFAKVPFPVVILAAALAGFVGGKIWKNKFITRGAAAAASTSVLGDDSESPKHTRPSLRRAVKITVLGVPLWVGPIAALSWWQGTESVLFQEGVFFSKAAVVTFGGAYAVLPYVAQQAVDHYQWLQPGQMMDGLGLAETTPGPLIMVTQFVGFMGGWARHGEMNQPLAATLGALITTWVTFTPCFLWIFLGGPYIERLRGNDDLTATLSAVTAAVVGVVLNLAVWFAVHVLVPPSRAFDLFALIAGAVAFVGLMRWNWNVVAVVIGSGVVGLAYRLLLA